MSGPRVRTGCINCQTRRRSRPSFLATASTSAFEQSCCRARRSTRSLRLAASAQSASVHCTPAIGRSEASSSVVWSGNVSRAGSAATGGPLSPRNTTQSAPSTRSTRQRLPACSTTAPGTIRCSMVPSSENAGESGNGKKRRPCGILLGMVHVVQRLRQKTLNCALLRAKSRCNR